MLILLRDMKVIHVLLSFPNAKFEYYVIAWSLFCKFRIIRLIDSIEV